MLVYYFLIENTQVNTLSDIVSIIHFDHLQVKHIGFDLREDEESPVMIHSCSLVICLFKSDINTFHSVES